MDAKLIHNFCYKDIKDLKLMSKIGKELLIKTIIDNYNKITHIDKGFDILRKIDLTQFYLLCWKEKQYISNYKNAFMGNILNYNDYIRYLVQVNDNKILEYITTNIKFFDDIKVMDNMLNVIKEYRMKTTHKNIKNKKTFSGNEIYMYSAEQLIEYDGFVFDFIDLNDIRIHKITINPYNNEPFTKDFLDTIEKNKRYSKCRNVISSLNYIFPSILLNRTCLKYTNIDGDKNEVFYYSEYEINELPQQFPIVRFIDIPIHKELKYIYKIHIKEYKIGMTLINKNDVKYFKLIYNPNDRDTDINFEELLTKLNGDDLMNLKRFINGNEQVDLKDISKYNIKQNKDIKVYRGISISKRLFDEFPEFKKIKYKDITEINSKKDAYQISWTTQLCVAETFASAGYGIGFILATTLKPEDIIIDTRLLLDEFVFAEREIISIPKKFKVRILKMIKPDTVTRFDVNDLDMYFKLKII